MESDHIPDQKKENLRKTFKSLNPFELKKQIETKLKNISQLKKKLSKQHNFLLTAISAALSLSLSLPLIYCLNTHQILERPLRILRQPFLMSQREYGRFETGELNDRNTFGHL